MNTHFTTFCLLVFTLFFSVSCVSQSSEGTPEAVKVNFKEMYPGENDPDWHRDKNNNFEANFKKNGIHYKADFSPDGKWIETESKIKEKDLPEAIREVIEKDYKDHKVVEVELVIHHSKGTFYDVEFKKDGDKFDIEFNAMGQKIN